jgi:integrase
LSGRPRRCFRFQLGPGGERKLLKTDDSEGVVPIPEQLAAELRAHLERTAERGIPGEFVFAHPHRPAASSATTWRASCAERSGPPDAQTGRRSTQLHEDRKLERGEVPSLHSFRHTLATRMSDAGATAEEIQRQLRHADANVTRAVYIHEMKDAERRQG